MPANALAVFAAKAPVEPTAPTLDRGNDNGSDFKDYMDTATHKVDKAQKPSKEDSLQNQSENRTEKTESKTKTHTDESSDQHEVSTTKENQPQSTTETVSKESLIEDNQVLASQLSELDINQDQFEAMLELLGLNGDVDMDALLQSLNQALNLNPNGSLNKTTPVDLIANLQQNKGEAVNLIANLQQNKGEAVNLLKQAGFSEAEAKNFLDQLQSLQNVTTQKALDKNGSKQAKLGTQIKQTDEASTKKPATQVSQDENIEEPDFLTQFKDAAKETNKTDRIASVDKPSETPKQNEAPRITSQEPASESGIKASNFVELLKDKNSQANLVQTEKPNDGKAIKGLETSKTGPDLQIQSPTVNANNAVKAVEASKPILPENLLARGASESKIINQIVDKLNIRTNGAQNEVHVKLDPPSLGTVRMKIVTTGEIVRTVIVAENHAVKQIIENNFNQLREALGEQGLKLDSFSVTVGGESGGQNPSQEFLGEGKNSSKFEEIASIDTDENPGTGNTVSLFFGDDQSINVIA